jgi:nucleotide-binding universal stress UspA family protein
MTKGMRVLIGYDGSIYADAAIEDLRRAALPEKGEALVVSVGEEPVVPPFVSDESIDKAFISERTISIANHARAHISESLASAKDDADAAGRQFESYFPNWRVRTMAVGGSPAIELIQKAREWAAHLLVVGSQGRSAVGRLLFGSVSLEVAVEAPCSVRIGRELEPEAGDARRIIVGLDASEGSERAIKHVLKRSWPKGTELRLIAVEDGTSLIKTAEMMSVSKEPIELSDAPGLKVFAEIKKGDPASILIDEAHDWKAHCIVVDAGGFGSSNNGTGNKVSTRLATNADCSVEIVR